MFDDLYLLRIQPFSIFNLNSYRHRHALTFYPDPPDYVCILYLLSLHENLHPLSDLDLNLFLHLRLSLLGPNYHLLYPTDHFPLHCAHFTLHLFHRPLLPTDHLRVLDFIEVSHVLPLKPRTPSLPHCHLNTIDYICEVALYLGPVLATRVLLQLVEGLDGAATGVPEGVEGRPEVQVVEHKGVAMGGGQQDEKGLRASRLWGHKQVL